MWRRPHHLRRLDRPGLECGVDHLDRATREGCLRIDGCPPAPIRGPRSTRPGRRPHPRGGARPRCTVSPFRVPFSLPAMVVGGLPGVSARLATERMWLECCEFASLGVAVPVDGPTGFGERRARLGTERMSLPSVLGAARRLALKTGEFESLSRLPANRRSAERSGSKGVSGIELIWVGSQFIERESSTHCNYVGK